MQTIIFFLVTTLFAITAYAANNWGEPCVSGICHYDLHPEGPSSGTLKIWGSHKVISDITPAAGWRILECDEDAMEQVMRMFCFSQEAPCAHLFSHNGPENKIVRLPERCGKNPFARIVRVWTSHDQSLPPKLARRLQKRDGKLPLVYNVAFDTNFHAVDPIHGPVYFAVQAGTIPNVDLNIDTHLPLEKRSGRPVQRNHKDIGDRSLKSIQNSIRSYVEYAERVKDADDASVNRRSLHTDFDHAKSDVSNFAKNTENDVEHDIPIRHHKIFNFVHDFDNLNMTLVRASLNCGPHLNFGAEVDVNPTGSVTVVMGVTVVGKMIPPDILYLNTVTHLSANLDIILTVSADVLVRFEKSPPPILTIPMGSITFPGIIDFGPEFQLNLLAGIALDIVIGTRIEIRYHITKAEIIFPHGKKIKPDIGFDQKHVMLASTPFVRGVAAIDLHIIPTIFVGIKAFGRSSGFNIMVDSFLLVRLVTEYNHKTDPIKTRGFDDRDLALGDMFDTRHIIHEVPISARSMGEMRLGSIQGRSAANVAATSKRNVEDLPSSSLHKRSQMPGYAPWAGSGLGYLPNVKPDDKGQINGCFQLLIIFDISVGAIDVLFKIFDQNTRFSVWRQVYLLYQHCFGTSQPKGGSTVNLFHDWWKHPILPRRLETRNTSPRPISSLVKRSGNKFKCLSTTVGTALMINTQNINLSKTQALR